MVSDAGSEMLAEGHLLFPPGLPVSICGLHGGYSLNNPLELIRAASCSHGSCGEDQGVPDTRGSAGMSWGMKEENQHFREIEGTLRIYCLGAALMLLLCVAIHSDCIQPITEQS